MGVVSGLGLQYKLVLNGDSSMATRVHSGHRGGAFISVLYGGHLSVIKHIHFNLINALIRVGIFYVGQCAEGASPSAQHSVRCRRVPAEPLCGVPRAVVSWRRHCPAWRAGQGYRPAVGQSHLHCRLPEAESVGCTVLRVSES